MEEQEKPQQSINADEEELTSDYANNVYYVASIWDLKLLFGELSSVKQSVDWHTSITMPWAAAKLMAYYLNVNIAAHEANHGRIHIPPSVQPPPPPVIQEEDKDNESVKALIAYINEVRQKFLAES